jgi:ABC-2 type transport system ATP-binding protein
LGDAVDVINVTKKFGKKIALSSVSFSVNEGEVFGLIGPNGAGKTTMLRIISGIIVKFKGVVNVFGVTPKEAKLKGMISYLPEDASPYERLSGYENLYFYSMIYARGNKRQAEEMANMGVKIANLGEKINDRAGEYSKGMKRRLLLARALMTNPKLAILDEPMAGLDVESTFKIRRKMRSISKELGTTVIFSSHDMTEIERLCDRVGLIDRGRIVALGTPDEIMSKLGVSNMEEAFIKATGGSLD